MSYICTFFAVHTGMANLDSVLIALNTKLNLETNAAIHSSQSDSVGRNGPLFAAPVKYKYRHINNIFPAWKNRRLTLGTEI